MSIGFSFGLGKKEGTRKRKRCLKSSKSFKVEEHNLRQLRTHLGAVETYIPVILIVKIVYCHDYTASQVGMDLVQISAQ